ncbi:MAG: 1-acylglycerol-3-phosphate O-acyltransferase [Trizodia sp. TS-e1964]|nr:MAG: 1-acylglycerol-3-phosphate O-acyltransferase [Trizodia sp. TS-e1964]
MPALLPLLLPSLFLLPLLVAMLLFALQLPFYARLLLAYLSLLICASYGVVASLVLRVAGYGGCAQWATARCFKWVMRGATGVRFEVRGERNLSTRPAVFIGNHQTELDVLMLGTVFPPWCSVTAKKSLRNVPFLGWFMSLSGTVFIDRANRQTALLAIDSAAQQIQARRQSVYIFPEGTRSYFAEPDLLPFKKGAFHLAVQAGVPIVPIVVANYADVLHVQSRRFTGGVIPVKVLEPIETKHLRAEDVDELTRETRELMLRELLLLTAEARATSAARAEGRRAVGVEAAKKRS